MPWYHIYITEYWFSTARTRIGCWLAEVDGRRTDPAWITAVLVSLLACTLCARLSPSLRLALPGKVLRFGASPSPVFTQKFVSMTSEGPPLSKGMGLERKCSSMSKRLWNQRCWTRQWPSAFNDSRKCWKKNAWLQPCLNNTKSWVWKRTNLCSSLKVKREHVISLPRLALSYQKYSMPLLSSLGHKMRRLEPWQRSVKPGVWGEWVVVSCEWNPVLPVLCSRVFRLFCRCYEMR
jgi:hypothetical protein